MIEPGRKFVQGLKKYRYGFNGKENDNEVKGEGNQQDYGMRINDPRLGRFLSEDPITKKYPELTPYQFASNRPIDGVDEDGLEYSPAGRSGIHQLATDATAVQHYHADPTLLNKQVANAPERQHARAAMEIQQHVRQKTLSQSNSTVGQGQAPTPYSIERKKVLNENYYALHPPASALEKNKHFQKFAEHMALPLIEGAAGDGLFRVLGKAGSALFKVSKAATPTAEVGFALTKHGELTNGIYTVSQEAMKKHVFGGIPGKSIFYPTLNANEAVLKAAQYADDAGLWIYNAGTKAKVPVLNTNIGVTGLGEPTNVINIYRKPNGSIHGAPGN